MKRSTRGSGKNEAAEKIEKTRNINGPETEIDANRVADFYKKEILETRITVSKLFREKMN
jgi:hypothetical protein